MFPIPLPGMPTGGLPGMSYSTGPAISGADSHSSLSTPIISPFTFDSSNWQVQVHSSGSQSATSASGADTSGAAGATGGLPLRLIALAAAAWFLLK